jgi:hypothetical protein
MIRPCMRKIRKKDPFHDIIKKMYRIEIKVFFIELRKFIDE